jgi:hypothetical protein
LNSIIVSGLLRLPEETYTIEMESSWPLACKQRGLASIPLKFAERFEDIEELASRLAGILDMDEEIVLEKIKKE